MKTIKSLFNAGVIKSTFQVAIGAVFGLIISAHVFGLSAETATAIGMGVVAGSWLRAAMPLSNDGTTPGRRAGISTQVP